MTIEWVDTMRPKGWLEAGGGKGAQCCQLGLPSFWFLKIFICLPQVLVVAHRIFGLPWGRQTLSCSMWDLIPQPGIEPRLRASGAQSLVTWTLDGREVPIIHLFLPIQASQPSFTSSPSSGLLFPLLHISSALAFLLGCFKAHLSGTLS